MIDLGAGNGWLSYRLAQRGHHPIIGEAFDGPDVALVAGDGECQNSREPEDPACLDFFIHDYPPVS